LLIQTEPERETEMSSSELEASSKSSTSYENLEAMMALEMQY